MQGENLNIESDAGSISKDTDLQALVADLSERLAGQFYNVLQVLANIVTFTEKFYDGSHSRFVAEKSAEIAFNLGMQEEDVIEVKIAAILHDIGKVSFFDSALFKDPNEMSATEYQQFHLHPLLGMEILKPYAEFDSIGRIILQHHERLDGTGFPNHLSGNSIHPAAKIISVVDIFHNAVFKKQRARRSTTASTAVKSANMASYLDATKDRYASVMNYLHRKKGILFEKKVVEEFINIMELERRTLGSKSVLRIPVNKIEPGMLFAEDYFTSYGMLIAARGEKVSADMKKALVRFAENGEIPLKILVIK